MENKAARRPLSIIAAEIYRDWKKPYIGADPYINAMMSLDGLYITMTGGIIGQTRTLKVEAEYGSETASDIVLRFLANASTWKGDTARRVKAELRAMLKEKP